MWKRTISLMNYNRTLLMGLSLFLTLSIMGGAGYLFLGAAGDKGSYVPFTVQKGDSLRSVASRMKKEGLIRNETALVFYGRMTGATNRVKEGVYRFSPGYSSLKMLSMMVHGRVWTQRFTVPEGYTALDIANKLDAEKVGKGKIFLELVRQGVGRGEINKAFLKENHITSLEGYLFPDTYEYVGATLSEKELVEKMLSRFEEKVLPEWKNRPTSYPYSLKDTIKLASLIEREAKEPEERPVIGGVFVNRLNRGMKLESCASVDYALGRHSTGVLTFKDIEVDSPYNTYKHPGLPPGPISNPGLASIDAALNYQKTGYLYFVARGDGSHIFTSTFADHLRAQRMINSKQNQ